MMSDDDLRAWVKQNRAKIKTLRTKAIRSTNKFDRDRFTVKADAMEEFTNWLEDTLRPPRPAAPPRRKQASRGKR